MEAVHEGKRNVYFFEMNGKKHSIHPFKGKEEGDNNQLLMMTDKKMVTDRKYEADDNEVELNNMVCSGWLKDKTDQQVMSNASMELMEEAQYEVINDDGKCMVTEITKDSDVTVTSRRGDDQRHQAENYWIACIIMLISFMFSFVTGRLNYLCADEEHVDKIVCRSEERGF